MSLKGFHLLFISIATLLCVFVAIWSFVMQPSSGAGTKVFGGSCILAAIVLPIYGARFRKKAKDLLI